ncbi:MAG TPA: YkvA family protein [Gaiellaceae bacterium]|jgi:uncharacterized membrane protein YkvA (DUF1232 family)
MGWWQATAAAVLAALGLYALCIAALVIAGRRETARALARFVPDCIVLFRRLLADPRVPRRTKLLLGALIGYLALPFDLVPDFIPVAGYLDDAVVVALVLRHLLRTSGPDLIHEHWPGSPGALALILRLAGHHHAAASAPEELGDRARVRLLPSPAGRGDVNLTPQGRVVSAAGESPTRRPTDR